MAVASANDAVKRRILNTLASVRCNGVATFSLAGCVFNGTFCSNRGACVNGACTCDSGFDVRRRLRLLASHRHHQLTLAFTVTQGTYCEKLATNDDSLSTGAVLGIVLGTRACP
jgi:hypothetical protein